MIRFLSRRALWLALTVWAVMTVAFFLMHAVPGGPFSAERSLNPAVERNVDARYHLDWPLWRQYLHYLGPLNLDEHGIAGDRTRLLGGVLTGDLGPSFQHRDLTVNDVLESSLPVSVGLGSAALLWAILVGVGVGIVSALKPGSAIDVSLRLLTAAGIALPNFVIASVLVLGLALTVPLFPVAGWGTLKHLVLPSLALGAPFAAIIARLTRTGMLEVLSQDHIRTAQAKGVSRRAIVLRHALRGGLLPVVSYLGPAAAGVLTGSLVIERIFTIPGTGSHFVESALNRDYTLALGVTLVYTVGVFVLNTAVDVAYGFLDPRIRLEEG